MLTTARILGLASVAAIFANGCAPQTEVVKLYDDPARSSTTYERLLVIVVSSDGMLQEDIDRLSDTVGADGILISQVVSVDTSVKATEGRSEIESTCRGGDLVDLFLYDHEVIREPDSVKVAHTVTVVTSLYDTASEHRVWTMEAVLSEEASAIVRQLRTDKLI